MQIVFFLMPTSKEPYDPYKIMCDRDLGKYTHPKLVKVMNKATKTRSKIEIKIYLPLVHV